MKKVLILGAGEYQVSLIKKAKEMKLHTLVVSPKGNYPGFNLADNFYCFDLRDKDEILKIAIKEKIDGVITDQTDIPVRTVAYIAEKCKLPGIGYDISRLFTDKLLMREKCKEIGLPVIEHGIAENIKEAKILSEKIGYPFVIKPLDNQGSRGVFKISDIKELEKLFNLSKAYSSNQRIIIEKFIDGQEFVVESIVYNKQYESLIIGDTYCFDMKNRFIPRKRVFPSVREETVQKKILEIDKNIIIQFGLTQGITHGEYVVDKKTNNIYLIEVGARGGGVNISSIMIPAIKSLDTNKFLLDIAMGKKVSLRIKRKDGIVIGYVAFYLPIGKVISIKGIEEVEEIDGVIEHNIFSIKKNQYIESLEDKSSRKTIIIQSKNRNEFNSIIEKIKLILDIKVLTRKGTSGIIWR